MMIPALASLMETPAAPDEVGLLLLAVVQNSVALRRESGRVLRWRRGGPLGAPDL